MVDIEYDPDKRERTLSERGLDFARAHEVFAGRHLTAPDTRVYSEPRFITVGHLDARMVVMVWTPRGQAKRVISMRKANEREKERFENRLGGP
jgi:uncharacterized DUF497 family protein